MFMEYVVCNRKTSILKDGKSKLTYFDILSNVLEKVPANGLTLAEMKNDFELLDKLNNKEENAVLNGDEYDRLSALIDDTRWSVKHRDLIEFDSYFKSLK